MRGSALQGTCESRPFRSLLNYRTQWLNPRRLFLDSCATRISLKMITEPPGCETQESFVTKINELLPPDIRVWGFQRATSGFNART